MEVKAAAKAAKSALAKPTGKAKGKAKGKSKAGWAHLHISSKMPHVQGVSEMNNYKEGLRPGAKTYIEIRNMLFLFYFEL